MLQHLDALVSSEVTKPKDGELDSDASAVPVAETTAEEGDASAESDIQQNALPTASVESNEIGS